LINGRVYAFGRPSGESLWQTPAEIEDFGLPIHQPADVPTLWFMRQQPAGQFNSRATIRANRASILCLDRRDGRPLLARSDVTLNSSFFAFEADAENQTVRLLLPTATFSLQFTGEEVPPEPPAQSGQVLRHAQPAAP
jgi:hypothetical protein